MILLSRFNPTNKKITYYFEIERLSTILFQVFGEDVDKIEPVKQEEFNQGEWVGRKWDFGDIAFRFLSQNGYFQLYYDFNNVGES